MGRKEQIASELGIDASRVLVCPEAGPSESKRDPRRHRAANAALGNPNGPPRWFGGRDEGGNKRMMKKPTCP
jgi:hypothetical protein